MGYAWVKEIDNVESASENPNAWRKLSDSGHFPRVDQIVSTAMNKIISGPTKRKVLSVRPTSFDKADLQDASGVETIDSAVSSYF